MTEEQLQTELERAYRCISGFYAFARAGKLPDEGMIAYQAMVIGAARRFVIDGELGSSEFFDGKPPDVLQSTLLK